MNLLHLLAALLLVITLAFAPRVHAATSARPLIDGLSGGNYKPLTTPALTGNNFAATGRVLVNGKWINIPGYLPPASTAAQAAKSALWSNPWLIGLALLGWAGDAGLGSDQIGWQVSIPGSPGGDRYGVSADDNCDFCAPTQQGACGLLGGNYFASTFKCMVSHATCVSLGYSGCTSPTTGLFIGSRGTYPAVPETDRPATQADFDALPAPPPQALAELAPQVGVPVDAPVYEPIDVDIGTPYTKPDGSTAQQRARISPSGDGEVWIDTYEQPLTDSQGTPVPDAPPVDLDEPSPTQCEKFPQTLGCALLGDVPDQPLPSESRGIDLITPVSIGNAGQCPAPMTATVAGMTIEWSFDPLCQYANALRPLVLALAWLSAGIIFIGGVRNG